MLRITQSESAEAAKRYLASNLRYGDYYLEGLEAGGYFGGKGAELLGLKGPVEREVFSKLLDNIGPNGKRLTGRTLPNRRPGYDFTFDVPKSVSLVYLLGGDERIAEAMRIAVEETMAELETEMYTRVRKNGADEVRRTGNILWGDFMHTTSRPAPVPTDVTEDIIKQDRSLMKLCDKSGVMHLPDPHLHRHVFVINATYDEVEKQWKAGDFMRIKRDASYYQAAYHARLAGELQKLGYTIEPTAKAFELAGVPRDVGLAFSRRTKEVEEAAKALGITDPEAKAALGAKTRHGKDHSLSLGELKRLWEKFVPSGSASNLKHLKEGAISRGLGVAIDELQAAKEGIAYALEHELERVSETSQKRVLATALAKAVGHVAVGTVHEALKFTPGIITATIEGEERLTTKLVLEEETVLREFVRQGRGTARGLVSGGYQFTNPLFKEVKESTAEQPGAILHVLQSQDWIVGIIGRAGTGKTTLLKEIHEGLKGVGKKLVLCAPTAEAARGVLREEGFASADTVKRILTDTSLHASLKGNVLWIDEAGMLGNKDMLALMKLAKAHGAARVVLAGDPTQIRSVVRGDAFRYLEQNAGLSVARLEKIKRQKTVGLKAAVGALSQGDAVKGLELLGKEKCIIQAEAAMSHKLLAKTYADKLEEPGPNGQKKSVLVVCPTHKEGEQVTAAIRSELKASCQLARDEVKIPRTVNLSLTESEKLNAATYEKGMVVQFKQRQIGFEKSERVRVLETHSRAGRVVVLKNDGHMVDLPLKSAKHFQVYRVDELKIAAGDKLRLTENGFDKSGQHQLTSGRTMTVAGFTKDGDIRLQNGHVLARDHGHVNYGYVVTADSAQAKTVDTVLVAVGQDSIGATDLRRMYVAVSRARDEAKIFTDNREALLQAAKRDTPRRFASDIAKLAKDEINHRIQQIHHQVNEQTKALRHKQRVVEQTKKSKKLERGMDYER